MTQKRRHIKPSRHARVTDSAPERIAALHNILVKERELCNARVVVHLDKQTDAAEDMAEGKPRANVDAHLANLNLKTEAHIKSVIDFVIVQLSWTLDSYSNAIDLLSLNEQTGNLTPPEEQTHDPAN